MSWYPEEKAVPLEGTPSTIQILKSQHAHDFHFVYAAFGVYEGVTALTIAEYFSSMSTTYCLD
jgi:hypothetical protein